MMIQEFQTWVLKLNETFTASHGLINLLTGLIFVVTILSMDKFKYTLSSQYKWSKTLYFSACIFSLTGISINRLVNYPTEYPLSSALYLLAYLFFCGYILYAGSINKRRMIKNGKQTINPAPNY